MTSFGTGFVLTGKANSTVFLNALWRDFVWDGGGVMLASVDGNEFLYALWRDFVWDLPGFGKMAFGIRNVTGQVLWSTACAQTR